MHNSAEFSGAPVWFLFGLAGVGKNHVADLIAHHTGWPVYHADADISDEMRLALAEKRPFTDAMRDEYFARMPRLIRQHQQPGTPLIVTQGAYKQRHRNLLRQQLPQLSLVWIDAPQDQILQRLASRQQGIGADSAAALLRDFEAPEGDSYYVSNDGDDNRILAQCRRFIPALNDVLTASGQVI